MTDLLSPLIDLSFYRLRYNLNMPPLHRNGRKSLKTEQSVLLTGPPDYEQKKERFPSRCCCFWHYAPLLSRNDVAVKRCSYCSEFFTAAICGNRLSDIFIFFKNSSCLLSTSFSAASSFVNSVCSTKPLKKSRTALDTRGERLRCFEFDEMAGIWSAFAFREIKQKNIAGRDCE